MATNVLLSHSLCLLVGTVTTSRRGSPLQSHFQFKQPGKEESTEFKQAWLSNEFSAALQNQTDMADLEFKVDYSAPKRDLTLVEAPETVSSVEWFLPDLYEYDHLSELVPWREGRKMFQDFVDRLPRPSIVSADDDDHTCPICITEYDSAGPEAERDTAVALKCGHIMGSYCLLTWVNGYLERGCPFCRRTMMLQDSKIKGLRADDMKRFLFWVLRTRGGNIGIEMLNILEYHKICELIDKRIFAISINHSREEAEIKKEKAATCVFLCHRKSAQFLEVFCKRMACRVARSGKSGLDWLRTSMTKAAAECVLHRMSGYALAELVDSVISDPGAKEEIERYVADKEYGPYGDRVDYSDLPGITLGHFHSSKPSRRTVFMHGFMSEFPVLLDLEFLDDGSPIVPDPDLALPFPSSHEIESPTVDDLQWLGF